ncbi:M48 family metallopeptidase [Clostridium sp. Cult2]|uniref:M48 family metallopeptidase n=1 Tax=Clostridium sp. Cult2 TaxID=2079003 RepID=UPI001F484689|nr:SprT family zinc-dependent metalloprotease [Clostridium sp. Cult2]MCF6464881.1 metal-dependent hydrolase [Clostridium sp. Cult2]
MEKIIINDIEIELTKKNIKNLHLSVHPPDGKVKISAPKNMDDDAIRLFAISKLSWIKKQQKKFKNQDRQPEREFVSGESHYFLGQGYILNVVYTNKRRQGVKIRNKKYMDLYVRENTPKYLRERVMTEWYRKELKKLIPPLIEKWEPIMGVKVNEFSVKLMKTRWGTCNPTAKRIWLNLELAKRDPICLEYIVVHEMVHLLERSHNERFVAYMDKFMPNWRALKAELNGLIF